jgi:hypothetical protein
MNSISSNGDGFITINGKIFEGRSASADAKGNFFVDGSRVELSKGITLEQKMNLLEKRRKYKIEHEANAIKLKILRKETAVRGWDGERGEPIHEDAWMGAALFLGKIKKCPAPFLSACGDGYVHLQWRPDVLIRFNEHDAFYNFGNSNFEERSIVKENITIFDLAEKAIAFFEKE